MRNVLGFAMMLFVSCTVSAQERNGFENPDFGILEVYSNGACSTEVPMCSRLGVKVLMQGGNAVDSAVASAICVGIVNSFSSGIGGGGFMLIKKPGNEDTVDMIDFREVAPRNLNAKLLYGTQNGSKIGGLSVGVPSEVYGIYEAHRKYGKLPWKNLFQENIQIAKGFPVSNQLVRRINRLKEFIAVDPGLRSTYMRNNELLKEGDVVVRDNYAKTLETIMNNPEDFYNGGLADSIVKAVNNQGGVLLKSDLQEYKPVHRPVVEGKYHDYKVYTTNLPTSGPLVLKALNILEKYNLDKLIADDMQTGKFRNLHLLIEIFKFMMARRGELADPEFLQGWQDVVNEITLKETAEQIYKKIDLDKVLDAKEYGMKKHGAEDHGTTHINVVDKDDMMVLLTSTINLEFGAKFMDPETGIVFNNTMDDFYPPVHGDITGSVNSLDAGKRPFSSISPVILSKDDELLALGAAGGIRIPTSIVSTLFHLSTGKNLKEAIMTTRMHNHLFPDVTFVEHDIQGPVEQYLVDSGHVIEKSLQNTVFTSVQGILLKRSNGDRTIHAVSDLRKGGESFGY
ncbi:putative gamma-glutamyltransferase [Ordospora colligata]|nr:putative gamma-glutamyltransferase [Ordospora colligata]